MSLADQPAERPVVSSELVYVSHRVIDLRADVVAMADGSHATRDVVVHPGAVGIVALDDQDRVLLVQQYRHPVSQLLWEPPAGLLDEPGESALDAAKRELHEEAHLQADRWDVLLDAFTSPGLTSEAVRIFLARDVRPADGPKHEGEHEEHDMPVSWLGLDEALRLVFAGELHNPMAVMGVLATHAARAQGYAALRPAGAPWPQMGAYRGSRATHGPAPQELAE